MRITIKYCGEWNYYPRAASLAKELETEFSEATVDFIEGSGGVFDITKNGILISSKSRVGRFPSDDEIITKLKD